MADAQYIGRTRPVNESGRIQPPGALAPGRGVVAEKRPRGHSGLRLRILAHDPLPRLPRAVRITQAQVAQADLHKRLWHLPQTEVEHLLELHQRLAVVVLQVIRLADPVLRVSGEWVSWVPREKVE